jgi:hypothetical protein
MLSSIPIVRSDERDRTYHFGITNSLGCKQRVPDLRQRHPDISPLNEEYFLMTFFGFLMVRLYFGKISKRTRS